MKKTRTKSVGQEKNKEKAIELAVDQIERQFGKGSIMRLGAEGAMIPVESIPTGSLSLDIALGIGGVPRGRVIEIFGPEGSGKTTLTCSIIANAQKLGGVAAFIDAEHALDGCRGFSGCACPCGGNRGGDGGIPRGIAGASHVAGTPQTCGGRVQVENVHDIHKSDPHEDRCALR